MAWNDKAAVEYANELVLSARKSIHKEVFDGLSKGANLRIPKKIKVDFFSEPTLIGGLAASWMNLIILNRDILIENGHGCCVDLIGHEVAHVVADKIFGDSILSHGKEWKAVARYFGANPSATHNYKCDSIGAKSAGKFFLWTDRSEKHHNWFSVKQHYMAIKDGHTRFITVEGKEVTLTYNPKKESRLRKSSCGAGSNLSLAGR